MKSLFDLILEAYRAEASARGGPEVEDFVKFCNKFIKEAGIAGAYQQPGKSAILKLANGQRALLGELTPDMDTGQNLPLGPIQVNTVRRDDGIPASIDNRQMPASTFINRPR